MSTYRRYDDRRIDAIAGNGVQAGIVEKVKDLEILQFVLRRVMRCSRFQDGSRAL